MNSLATHYVKTNIKNNLELNRNEYDELRFLFVPSNLLWIGERATLDTG